MNLTELFDERSAAPSGTVMHDLRMAGVRHKVVVRRRQRLVAAVAAVLVLAAAGIGATTLPGADRSAPPVPPADRMIEGFPEYANGARVVAAASAELPTTEVTLTFTPTTLDLVLFERCDIQEDNPRARFMKIWVNDTHILGPHCGSGTSRPESWHDWGVRVGEPFTVTATIESADLTGSFGVAIGEEVPFAEYPLPSRPETLPELDERTGVKPEDVLAVLRAAPGEPNQPRRAYVEWETPQILVSRLTPGYLRVLVNGIEVLDLDWWEYEDEPGFAIYDNEDLWEKAGVVPGQRVVIEVIPEHMTGDWIVMVLRSGSF